jgi:hypothetical protein
MYLGDPPLDRHKLAVWAGGHVAEGQYAGERIRRRLELQAQDVGGSAFSGFDDGAGVVGYQSAQHGIGVLGAAQVAGAVECVQACHSQAGRSRSRAARRRLRGGRRPHRQRVPGCVPARRRLDVHPAAAGCQPCLALGDSWVDLRMCMTDGEVL